MYIKRNIENSILNAANQFACITIYGSRQVGKSTMIKHLFSDKFSYVTLDDIKARGLAKKDPKLFFRNIWISNYNW